MLSTHSPSAPMLCATTIITRAGHLDACLGDQTAEDVAQHRHTSHVAIEPLADGGDDA